MSDSFMTMMIVLIAAVLIFIAPMVAIGHRNDVIATQQVQTAIIEFIDKIRTTGQITQNDYSYLVEEVYSTRRII